MRSQEDDRLDDSLIDGSAYDSDEDDEREQAESTTSCLPFEIVYAILSAVADDTTSQEERQSALRGASLVCRGWTYPAQRLLWKVLVVEDPTTAHRILTSTHVLGAGGATHDLTLRGINGGVGLSGTVATKLLDRFYGLKRLVLRDFKRLSCKILERPSLEGLTSLAILTGFPDSPARQASLNPPFHLRHLSLHQCTVSPFLIDALFQTQARSLSTLDISLLSTSPGYDGLQRSFHLIAANLATLGLHHRVPTSFVPELRACHRLKHLTCYAAVPLLAVIDAIPSPLVTLSFDLDWDAEEILVALCQRFDKGTPSLCALSRIEVHVAAVFANSAASQELARRCLERDVVLRMHHD